MTTSTQRIGCKLGNAFQATRHEIGEISPARFNMSAVFCAPRRSVTGKCPACSTPTLKLLARRRTSVSPRANSELSSAGALACNSRARGSVIGGNRRCNAPTLTELLRLRRGPRQAATEGPCTQPAASANSRLAPDGDPTTNCVRVLLHSDTHSRVIEPGSVNSPFTSSSPSRFSSKFGNPTRSAGLCARLVMAALPRNHVGRFL
mmetsp:Transcript_73259/g.238298  ORF Transcript_73259/g.238298 Transcript_73259/m.238298 type:complete len:205 (+) Transcript_73259:180-794(+)